MIGQENHISHTQVIYHFSGKTSIGRQVIENYFQILIQLVSSYAEKITGNLEGFCVSLTEEEVVTFVLDHQVLDAIAELDEFTLCC